MPTVVLLSELIWVHSGCFLHGVFMEVFRVWGEVYQLQKGHV